MKSNARADNAGTDDYDLGIFHKKGFTQRRKARKGCFHSLRALRLCVKKLLCKNQRKIFKTFEFERVAARVEKEHRRLFADFAGEADFRLDDKFDAFRFQLFG